MARRKTGLNAEDRALWARVAATTTPLDRPGRKIETTTPPKAAKPKPEPLSAPEFDLNVRIGSAAIPQSGHHLAPSVAERINTAPVRMHHGTHKKMVRGKLKPEGRIDLHGLTLAQAHPRLVGFILDANAAGKRLVLVITGKGRDRDEPGPIPIRRGALRHQVPGWLTAPPLGAVVLDIRTAHLRHGGEGAYYVYLKRHKS